MITSRQTDPELHEQVFSIADQTGCILEHSQLVNVGVEDAVDESNTRALVGILVREFHMDLPMPAGKRCCMD